MPSGTTSLPMPSPGITAMLVGPQVGLLREERQTTLQDRQAVVEIAVPPADLLRAPDGRVPQRMVARARRVLDDPAEREDRMAEMLTKKDLAALAAFDTPTICNALEIVAPERRALGLQPQGAAGLPLPRVRSRSSATRGPRQIRSPASRRAWRRRRSAEPTPALYYASIEEAPAPSIAVIQDLDGPDAGFGAFWGEVQSTIHKGLGCARRGHRWLHPRPAHVGAWDSSRSPAPSCRRMRMSTWHRSAAR